MRCCGAIELSMVTFIFRSVVEMLEEVINSLLFTQASLVVVANRITYESEKSVRGISVLTVPDIRWGRADIKTISLLPNVLAKQKAVVDNFNEAWFVESNGRITEGASTNAWIVDANGNLITRGLGKVF